MKTALMRRPVRTLIREEFWRDQASPLGSVLKAEPGPGLATVTDTGSKLSISGSVLNSTSTTVSGADPKLTWPDQGVRPGIAALFFPRFSASASTANKFGWPDLFIRFGSGTAFVNYAGVDITTIIRAANLGYLFVLDPLGAKIFLVSAPGPTEVVAASLPFGRAMPMRLLLLWIHRGTITSTAPFIALDTVALGSPNSVIMMDLGAGHPTATSYGIAADRQMTPASPATAKAQGNGSIIEFVWNPAANEIVDIWFRRSDAQNGYIVRLIQAAGTAQLIKVVAGVENPGVSVSPGFSVGTQCKVQVMLETARIRIYVFQGGSVTKTNTAQTGTDFNNQYDGVRVEGFSSADELTVWPFNCTKYMPAIM